MDAASRTSQSDALSLARDILRQQAASLAQLADQLGAEFVAALDQLDRPKSQIVVTGMGKAGLIGQKVSATFCSTGSNSIFLHPAEAIHGDLGRVRTSDVVLALSMSGETEELLRVLPPLAEISVNVVAITSSRASSLGRAAQTVIALGDLSEAGPLHLAPTTSTTAMLAVGDALAMVLSKRRGFQSRDFARFHPGGSLGRKLTKVQDVMRPLSQCRIAMETQSVRETFLTLRHTGRRAGAVMILDQQAKLTGVFTDSDLARLLEQQNDGTLDTPVCRVMTRGPITVEKDTLMPEAIEILAEKHISELPVVEDDGSLLGMIDITDVIAWLPDNGGRNPTALPRSLASDDVDEQVRIIPFPGRSA